MTRRTKQLVTEFVVGPLVVATVLGLAAWLWSLHLAVSAHDVVDAQHGQRLDNHHAALLRIEGKLDRLIELMTTRSVTP